MTGIDQALIAYVSSLSLKELISIIVTSGPFVLKYGANALQYVKETIAERQRKAEYGVVVSKQQAQEIEQLTTKEVTNVLRGIIGNHSSLKLISLGLYLKKLNDQDKPDNQQKSDEIRTKIKNLYGVQGLRITELSSTSVVYTVIDYLQQKQLDKNYSKSDLVREYDLILSSWREITYFVQASDSIKVIDHTINQWMLHKKPFFFVFGMGNAYDKAAQAIAALNVDREIGDKGYLMTNKYNSGKQLNMGHWIFELI